MRISGLVEKPRPEEAPSNFAIMGRYVLTPEIFDCIDRVEPGRGGEIQLTDAMGLLLEREALWGLPFTDGRYDTGNKLHWLRATVELALAARRPRSRVPQVPRRAVQARGPRMIPADEARAFVLASCARIHPKALPLTDVLGCATSVPLDAPEDVPPFHNTAMDGYAVRAADVAGASAGTPVRLEVVGVLPAGAPPTIEVLPGTAVRIMTGAAMPPGADAVVMVEETEASDDGSVLIRLEVAPGDAVRAAGSDVRAGERVFAPKTVIRPAHLGVLASLGYAPGAGVPSHASRSHLDRRRAGGGRWPTRTGPDPGIEPRDAARPGRERTRRPSISASPTTTRTRSRRCSSEVPATATR